MSGLGDTVYARPFAVKALERGPVTVRTAWPELWADLDVHVMLSNTQLRTQAKNIARHTSRPYRDGTARTPARRMRPRYGMLQLGQGMTVWQALERTSGVDLGPGPVEWTLPTFKELVTEAERVAVIRPVSVRSEWRNTARNPLPVYVHVACEELVAAGLHVVSVADIDGYHEERVGAELPAHVRYDEGELWVEELLGLVQRAEVVVGGPGWIIPATLAAHVPGVIIAGGQGGHNGPRVVTDPRMDTSRQRWILPDHYCGCTSMTHDCDKTITAFRERFRAALHELGVT